MQLGPYLLGPNETPENGIYTGDAKELAKLIPDESIDLIFTDPVYQNIEDYEWLAKTASRVLKSKGNLLAYCAHINLPNVINALSKSLLFRWLFVQRKFGIQSPIFGRHIYGAYIPVLWYGHSSSYPATWLNDVFGTPPQGPAVTHKWTKNPIGVQHLLSRFTNTEMITLDPFCGGGVTPAACAILGQKYLAFDQDIEACKQARQRVKETELPLFTEQISLF